MRALVHVQHLLGTGHVVRAARIACALARRGVAVTLVSGGPLPATVETAGFAVETLPAIRAADASFRLVDGAGAPVSDALFSARRDRLIALFGQLRPAIVLTETFPFGRRRFADELLPLLAEARAADRPPLVAASVRDILVAKADPAKERRMADLALDWYDLVLVHADPQLVRLSDSFPFADAVEPLVAYTGFVHAGGGPAPPGEDGTGEVIVSAGGGPVGEALFAAAIETRSRSAALAARPMRLLVSGADGGAARRRLAARAGPGVAVEGTRPDFQGLLSRAALSISQAGYNTVLDVVAAGVPAVLVPFAEAGETEQRQRAAALSARGVATVLDADALSPETLAMAAEAALARQVPRLRLDLAGADRSADILHARAGGAASRRR